jgi:hypothetical protein
MIVLFFFRKYNEEVVAHAFGFVKLSPTYKKKRMLK